MFKKFKGILIDIDNTLYDYDYCHSIGYDNVKKYCADNMQVSNKTFDNTYIKSRKIINKNLSKTASSHNRILYFQNFCEILNINPLKNALIMSNIYWKSFYDKMTLFPYVEELLGQVSSRKLCLITDFTANIQYQKVEKLNLQKYIGYMVTSEEVGIEKPNKTIFNYAIKKMGLKPKEVCMIGDNYQRDIIGATRLGIHSFWFNRYKKDVKNSQLVTQFDNYKLLLRDSYD
tara:strand:- start:4 stop:696 length:693 start_codon:yes stop_codon:yes gene_type:complete